MQELRAAPRARFNHVEPRRSVRRRRRVGRERHVLAVDVLPTGHGDGGGRRDDASHVKAVGAYHQAGQIAVHRRRSREVHREDVAGVRDAGLGAVVDHEGRRLDEDELLEAAKSVLSV